MNSSTLIGGINEVNNDISCTLKLVGELNNIDLDSALTYEQVKVTYNIESILELEEYMMDLLS